MPIVLDPLPPSNDVPQDGKWFVSTDPTDAVVTFGEAAAHMRLANSADQTYVTKLIAAAVDFAEDSMETSLAPRTITANFYDGEPIILPRTPLISISSVTANEVALSFGTGYTVKHVGRAAEVKLLSGSYPVVVVYQAGYADVTRVKPSIRQAILMHVATLYENRESITDRAKLSVPHTLEAFYRLNRRTVGAG